MSSEASGQGYDSILLRDLDIEAKKTCGEDGIAYSRAETGGIHPSFIRLLADRVQSKMSKMESE